MTVSNHVTADRAEELAKGQFRPLRNTKPLLTKEDGRKLFKLVEMERAARGSGDEEDTADEFARSAIERIADRPAPNRFRSE